MYSRLYREVLNQFSWVESITCFNTFYKNTGLFGFYGTAPHENVSDMMNVIAQHSIGMIYFFLSHLPVSYRCLTIRLLCLTTDMAVGFADEEVERAKNQLSASIFMHLESRMVLYDDIGRQVLAYGHR